MMLAYQSEDAHTLLEAYAAVYAPQIEPLELLPSANQQPHGHEGVYDRCLGRLVEPIAKQK